MQRLLGLLLIVRAFAPILAIGIIIWGVSRIAADMQAALDQPIQQLQIEFQAVGTIANDAKQDFQTAQQDMTAVVNRVRAFRVPDFLPNLPTALTFPSISIPSANIPLPSSVNVAWKSASFDVTQVIPRDCGIFDFFCKGLGDIIKTVTNTVQYPADVTVGTSNYTLQFPNVPPFSIPTPPFFQDMANGLKNVFAGLKDTFNVFDPALDSIQKLGTSLQTLSDSVTPVIGEGQKIVRDFRDTIHTWAAPLAIALVILVALVVISFSLTFVENLTRGLRLLLGRPS